MNVLAKGRADMVKLDPFPYIVIDNALPQDVYDRLEATYPDPERMLTERKQKNNHRYNLLSKWGATEFAYEEASEEWKAFTEANASPEFVHTVFELFPSFKENAAGSSKIDVSKFGPNLADKLKIDRYVSFEDVVPRVTVAVNTPVTQVSSVRGAHTDNVRKAYVGLLYFRLPQDDSTGGDLEIFKWKAGAKERDWAVKADLDEVDLMETIGYKPNRMILFLTTHNALHGVSPRSITPHWRRLVVISGWLPGVDHYDTDTMHGRIAGLKATVKAAARRIVGRSSVESVD